MNPFSILNPTASVPLVLTCEHASCAVPIEYDDLNLGTEHLTEHIGWDIGAREVTDTLASHFGATAVLAGVSRLVIDCNRDLTDHDLIVAEVHGVKHGLRYLEVEINNRLLRTPADSASIAAALARAVLPCIER
jgi:predicted N-formylglutamate amidohydrolase